MEFNVVNESVVKADHRIVRQGDVVEVIYDGYANGSFYYVMRLSCKSLILVNGESMNRFSDDMSIPDTATVKDLFKIVKEETAGHLTKIRLYPADKVVASVTLDKATALEVA